MKTATPSRNAHRPVRDTCPECGKRCYVSRRIAKQQSKILFPGQHMGVYGCDWNGWTWFHLTSEPQRKKEARKQVRDREREPFAEEALDRLYEKAEKEGAVPWNDATPEIVVIRDFETLEAMIDRALTDEERAMHEQAFPDEPREMEDGR